MGNAKPVDIHTESSAEVLKIDAKAGRAKDNWPIAKNAVKEDVHYVFAHLQTDKMIKNNFPSEYLVASGKDILSEDLIDTWETRGGIRDKTLNTDRYKGKWDKLPPP